MTEPYQDPDPISTNRTRKDKKRFRNPFARSKLDKSKTTPAAFSSSSLLRTTTTAATAAATSTYINPFTPKTFNDTDADALTLVNYRNTTPHDPDAEFHNVADRWKFRLKDRRASAPASDVGEHARATSIHDRTTFAELMEKTRGMTPDQVRTFLKERDRVDGEKIMNGRKGSGYQMMAGPFMGTM